MVAVSILWLVRRLLDVIEVGDLEAESLGLNVGRLRVVVVVAASLATAAAVSVAGLIGFVGIIVPHAIRLVAGTSYRQVLPLSVLFGASFLILVDILARTAVAPAEIPIGVITAFVGAPFFVLALRRAGAAIGVKLRPNEDTRGARRQRAWAFVSAGRRSSATSRSRYRRARGYARSARTAPGRPPSCTRWPA